MVKLPTLQPRGAVTRGPQSSLSAAEIANPYQQVADAFGAWGGFLENKGRDDAQTEGQNAVYRDEQGDLKVDLRANWSEKDRIYNRTATQSFLAQTAPEIRATAARLAREANGNPELFRSSWKGYRDQFLINAPNKELRGPLSSLLDETGTLQVGGIQDQKFRADMTTAKSAMLAEREFLSDQAASLALQGGTSTREYLGTIDKIRTLNGELTGNPMFQYGAREADIDMKRLEGRMMSESIIGQVDRKIAEGGVVEARALRDKLLSDPTLDLAPQDRRTYYNLADSRIDGFIANRKADLKPLQDRAKELKNGIAAGTVDMNSPEVDSLMIDLSRAGDPAASLDLLAARRKKIFADANNAAQVSMAERGFGETLRPAPARNRPTSFNPDMTTGMQRAMQHYIARGVPPLLAAGIIGNLVQESGLNPKARNPGDGSDGSDSVGLGQWNGDRARALKAFAARNNASPEDLGTQLDFVLHELETTEGAAYQRLKAATTVDEAVAAMIGYERPKGWTPENPRGGHGWSNRLSAGMKAAEMQGLKGSLLASSGAFPISDEEAKAYREEITRDVRAIIPDIEAGIKTGVPFSSESLNLLTRQLAFVDDQDLRNDVADMLERNARILGAQSAPPEEVEAAIGALRADMASGGVTAAKLDLAEGLEGSLAARQKALKADPLGYGISQGTISDLPAVNMGDPSSYASTLREYQRATDTMRATGQVGAISAFRPAQEDAYAVMWQTAPPEQLSAFTNALSSSLTPETLKATLSSGEAKDALVGAALSSDPVRHAEAMKQLDLLSVNTSMTDIEMSFGKDAADRLQDWQGRVRYFTAEETAEWLKQRNDPQWQKRIDPLIKKGKTEAMKVSAADVVDLLDTNRIWDAEGPQDSVTQRMLMNDFVNLVGERNGALDDVDKSKTQAVERMKKAWGVTSVFGNRAGRLMPYPPEQFYPAIGNSHDWMEQELQEIAISREVPVTNMSLVADRKTQAAIQRGEAPGYLISIIDPETGLQDLATDELGRPLRHFFDPQAVQQRLLEEAQAARAERGPAVVQRNINRVLARELGTWEKQ